jgi:hypothetical protein
MVLLLAFQRFTAEDWGRPADLNPQSAASENGQHDIKDTTPSTASSSSSQSPPRMTRSKSSAEQSSHPPQAPEVLNNAFRLKVQTSMEKAEPSEFISVSEDFPEFVIFPKDLVHRRYCLTGRGTCLVGASKTVAVAQPTEYVMKVYWPECTRLNEVEAIEHAHKLSRETHVLVAGQPPRLKYPFIKDHIPEIHGWRDFDEFDTSRIRLSLGLRTMEDLGVELTEGNDGEGKGKEREMMVTSETNTTIRRSRRVLRVIIFTRYLPISGLEPHQFWTAWEHCYCCECSSPCIAFALI